MITVVNGNILTSGADALVNPVNCVGVMGAGLAAKFAGVYPEILPDYKRACGDGILRPGKVQVLAVRWLAPRRYVINFPTKRHWLDASRLDDIDAGLKSLACELVDNAIDSVAIPALGCGLGGLAWDDVLPLIEAAFADLPDLEVSVYPPKVRR